MARNQNLQQCQRFPVSITNRNIRASSPGVQQILRAVFVYSENKKHFESRHCSLFGHNGGPWAGLGGSRLRSVRRSNHHVPEVSSEVGRGFLQGGRTSPDGRRTVRPPLVMAWGGTGTPGGVRRRKQGSKGGKSVGPRGVPEQPKKMGWRPQISTEANKNPSLVNPSCGSSKWRNRFGDPDGVIDISRGKPR